MTRYKREVKKPEVGSLIRSVADVFEIRLTNRQLRVLKNVTIHNPLRAHGIAHGNSALYRDLSALRDKGLVTKEGYRYYPTGYGLLYRFYGPRRGTIKLLARKKREGRDWRQLILG